MEVNKNGEKVIEETPRNEDPLAMEIDEMLGILEPEEKLAEEKVIEEAPTSDEPAGKKSPEVTETPVVETPAEEVEKPAETPTDAPTGWEAEKQELQSRIDLLVGQVEKLSEVKLQKAGQTPKEEKVVAPKAALKAQAETTPPDEGPVDFLGDDTIDVLIDEEGKFNKVLNSVYQTAVQEAEKKVFEKVLTSIPDIIVGHLNRQTTIQQVVKTFYGSNKDLEPVKRTVAAVANDVHSENPDWEITEVLKEAANRTRQMLGIKKGSSKPNEDSPAFAKSGGAKSPKKTVTTLQNEIDDLINF